MQKQDHDRAAVFAAACRRLGIRRTDAPRLFGVTRQTAANWINGKTKPPLSVFLAIVAAENEAAARIEARAAAIKETAERIKQ